MFEDQFVNPEKFDIQLLKSGTQSKCHFCSISFKSKGDLYTSGAQVTYLNNKNVVSSVACPVCCSTLFRFTDSFAIQEELASKLPSYLSAVGLLDNNYHSHKSIVLGAYKIASLIQTSDEYSQVVDVGRKKSIEISKNNASKIKKAKRHYSGWISALASSTFDIEISDSSLKKLLHTENHMQLGQSIRLRKMNDPEFDISNIAVYPTIEFILHLSTPQIGVFDRKALQKAAQLSFKNPISDN